MAEETGISWTDHTFNTHWGCTKVSPACDFCYAERDSLRYGHDVWGKDAPRRMFGDDHWKQPEAWHRKAEKDGVRRRVFCASMADVMEDRRDLDVVRARLFDLIQRTPQLDWLLLTKRPMNYRRMLPERWRRDPQPNVWLGTTVESADYLWRIANLVEVPAVVHFLSMEPLLSEMPQLGGYLWDIEWVITGGESDGGRKTARPTPTDWFRQVRDIAVPRGIAYHHKQNGEHNDLVRIGKKAAGDLLDGRQWKEFPR